MIQYGVAGGESATRDHKETPMTSIETYRQRLEAAERAGPQRPTLAKVLVGELRAAHRTARAHRDRAAASLHFHHGWTFTQLCTAIHGRPNKVAAVREAVEAVKPLRRVNAAAAEDQFRHAQQDVAELWNLYKRARTLTANGAAEAPPPAVDLPAEAILRAPLAQEELQKVTADLRAATERRNRIAAALVVHAGWSKRNAVDVAGAAVRDLYEHEATAKKADADPDRLVEATTRVRELTARRRALTEARDDAIRQLLTPEPKGEGMGPTEVATLVGGISDERIVQIRDAA